MFQRVQRDVKAPTGHREALHGAGHRVRQLARGLGAVARQRLRDRHICGVRLRFLGLQRIQIGRGLQCSELRLALRQFSRQRFRSDAVFARHRVQGLHARVDFGQAVRIQFRAIGIASERMHRFLNLHLGRLQRGQHIGKRRIDLGQFTQRMERRAQLREHRTLRFGQTIERRARAFDQAGGVRQAMVLGLDLFPLAGLGAKFLQFVDLPFDALALELGFARLLLGGFACAHHGVPLAVALADHAHSAFQACVGIEQAALRIRLEQQLMRMLAVNVDQLLAHFAQLCERDGRAVDEGFAAACGIDRAAQQDHALVVMQFMRFQPCSYMRVHVELGGDVGARRAFAYDGRIGALAQRECKRVDQDGFARARFAREYGETVGQIKIQRVNDDEIADGEAAQHGSGERGVLEAAHGS